jgi:error-prone DNA polymerase
LTLELTRQLVGTPRHLSQHPGGFVLTRDRLDDLVPDRAGGDGRPPGDRMGEGRSRELKIMKLDVLGLGMLGCMRRAFDLLAEHKRVRMNLWSDVLQEDDPAVFAMIRKADTIGTFQIESRAQMSMLPGSSRRNSTTSSSRSRSSGRVRSRATWSTPICAAARARSGRNIPRPELRAVLEKTLGVPLFQEQAMKVAIVGAGFTPAEADQLRRAMATFKYTGGVTHFRDKLIEGMVARHYPRDFAERTFKQIEGFGSYGFPESHAASFAKIAYASSWMKCHHPDIFCAPCSTPSRWASTPPPRSSRRPGSWVEVRPAVRQRE